MFLIYFLSRRHRQPRPFRNPLQQSRFFALSLLSPTNAPFYPAAHPFSHPSLHLSSYTLLHRRLSFLFNLTPLRRHSSSQRLHHLLISHRQVARAHTLPHLTTFHLRTLYPRIIVWTLQTARRQRTCGGREHSVWCTPGSFSISVCWLHHHSARPFAEPTFISLKSPGISEIALSYGNITRLRAASLAPTTSPPVVSSRPPGLSFSPLLLRLALSIYLSIGVCVCVRVCMCAFSTPFLFTRSRFRPLDRSYRKITSVVPRVLRSAGWDCSPSCRYKRQDIESRLSKFREDTHQRRKRLLGVYFSTLRTDR